MNNLIILRNRSKKFRMYNKYPDFYKTVKYNISNVIAAIKEYGVYYDSKLNENVTITSDMNVVIVNCQYISVFGKNEDGYVQPMLYDFDNEMLVKEHMSVAGIIKNGDLKHYEVLWGIPIDVIDIESFDVNAYFKKVKP